MNNSNIDFPYPTAQIIIEDGQILEDGEILNVTLTVNSACPMRCPVRVSFGTEPLRGGSCDPQAEDSTESLSPGDTATFSVDGDSVSRGSGERYCYLVTLCDSIGE